MLPIQLLRKTNKLLSCSGGVQSNSFGRKYLVPVHGAIIFAVVRIPNFSYRFHCAFGVELR